MNSTVSSFASTLEYVPSSVEVFSLNKLWMLISLFDMDRGKQRSSKQKSYGFVKLMYVQRSFICTKANSLIHRSTTLKCLLYNLHFSCNKSFQVKFQRNIIDIKFWHKWPHLLEWSTLWFRSNKNKIKQNENLKLNWRSHV